MKNTNIVVLVAILLSGCVTNSDNQFYQAYSDSVRANRSKVLTPLEIVVALKDSDVQQDPKQMRADENALLLGSKSAVGSVSARATGKDTFYQPTPGLQKVMALVLRLERQKRLFAANADYRKLCETALAILEHELERRRETTPLARENLELLNKLYALQDKLKDVQRRIIDSQRRIKEFNSRDAVHRPAWEADKLNQERRALAQEDQKLYHVWEVFWDHVNNDFMPRVEAAEKQRVARYAAFIKNAEKFFKEGDYLVSRWTGTWDKWEKEFADKALRGLKDGKLRNWLATNAEFNRFTRDSFSPLTAAGSTLNFKNGFFAGDKASNDVDRENLMAFEGGRVFFMTMTNKRVPGGETFGRWCSGFVGRHHPVIADMKKAEHRGKGLAGLGDFDTGAFCAYIFRARALRLHSTKGPEAQKKWDEVISEFLSQISPLLGK